MKHKYKTILAIILGLPVLGYLTLVIMAALLAPAPSQPSVKAATTVQPKQYIQDPALVAIMAEYGMDYRQLNLEFSDFPGQNRQIAAQYVSNGIDRTIQVRPGLPADYLPTAISHEYIHYIQDIKPATAGMHIERLQYLYQTDTYLQERVTRYKSGEICPVTNPSCLSWKELQAFACTELPDYTLGSELLAFCNKYLPLRSDLLYDKSAIYLN